MHIKTRRESDYLREIATDEGGAARSTIKRTTVLRNESCLRSETIESGGRFSGIRISKNERRLLFDMIAGFLGQFFRQRFDARKIVLEIAAGHHAGRHFEAHFAFGCVDMDDLQVGYERMVFLRGAKVPRAAVRVASAVTFHRSNAGYLTNSGHDFVS